MWCVLLISTALSRQTPETTLPPSVWKWQARVQWESHNYTLPCKLHVCVSWNNMMGKTKRHNTWDKHGPLWHNYRRDRMRQASEHPGPVWQDKPGSFFLCSLKYCTWPHSWFEEQDWRPGFASSLGRTREVVTTFFLFLWSNTHINHNHDIEMCLRIHGKETFAVKWLQVAKFSKV